MTEISAEGLERRDRKETLKLADRYLPLRRCVGGHLVHTYNVCDWCGSHSPSEHCLKEKVGGDETKEGK